MTIASVNFRGEIVLVKFKSHGYEADTNAHDIDWHFEDEELNQLNDLSEKEEQEIYEACLKVAEEGHEDDY